VKRTVASWDRRDLGIAALALAWLALTIGVRSLNLPDEGRYVGVAWEMLTSGNWLYPTLNGLPFFHKPPLFYWITASSLSLFGTHEWAARLAPLLGGAIAAFSLYGFLLRQSGRGTARWTLLILATQPLFFGGAQFANLDMLVAGFICAATLWGAEAALNLGRSEPYRGRLAGAYLAAALGMLAKGLIGIALPGMTILIWLAWTRRLGLLRRLVWLPGLALFFLVAAPWFVAMQERFPEFAHYFFVYNHFERFTEGGFNNAEPFWFYLPVVLGLTLPWSWWLAAAWRRHRCTADEQSSTRSLMWIWVAVIIGFFSIPSSKLVGYILPALPPLAYLVADALRSGREGLDTAPRALKWAAGAAVAICLSAVIAVAVGIFDDKSNKHLSVQLAAERRPEEPVVFVGDQFFDLPFYLRLRNPVRIFDDWSPAYALRRDNWRKALYEAGTFDQAKAGRLLLDRSTLAGALCAEPVTWVVGRASAAREYPFLQRMARLSGKGHALAWKVPQVAMEAAGLCAGVPGGGSPPKGG
jgi:4-amino-4-deoxy-L-arabinose transferase-like glycosyltransferase